MANKLVYSWADKLWQMSPPRKYIATRYRALKNNMKTKHLLIFLVFLSLAGCTEKKSIVGTWIEKDNFVGPKIWDITQDSFRIRYWNHYNTFYKIKGDTFMFTGFEGLKKNRYEIINDELNFYSVENDSLIVSLEKDSYNNFIDYFNKKKNTQISLPYLKSRINKFHPLFSSTFVFDKNDVSKIFINGEKVVLDNLTYINIYEIKSRHGYSTHSRHADLYCDQEIKLKDINRLKTELQKAGMQQITYVTQDSSNTLYGNYFRLPYLKSYLPDSIKQQFPTPPPAVVFDTLNSNDILCKISMTYKEINGEIISEEKYETFLKDKIKSESGFILHLNFDNQMNYKSYLTELMRTMDIYESIKKEYSHEKFNEPDYDNLDGEKIKEIREKFPVKIREIYKEEYEKLKKNAL